MGEAKIMHALREAGGEPDPKDTSPREVHLAETLAKIHELMVASALTHNEAIELYFRAMLGTAYDAAGNMSDAVDKLEGYLLTTLTKLNREAKPRITQIVERGKVIRPH